LSHDPTWDAAIAHFLEYLPGSISHWLILVEGPSHALISSALRARLPSCELVILADATAAQIATLESRYACCHEVGALQFFIKDGIQRYSRESRDALRQFSAWPCSRVRLCLDVWDDNFPALFSEPPQDVARRCRELKAILAGEPVLVCDSESPARSQLEIRCGASEWVTYTGFEDFEYMLPSGETACLPRSAAGTLSLDGWLVGTIPFGLKYGRVHPGDLVLRIEEREIRGVSGGRADLCRDFEQALDRLPGLRCLVELGVGQSHAVVRAAKQHPAGCLWLERRFGVHFGLGAELPETFDADQRTTSHHLDFVLATGSLSGAREILLRW